MTLAEAIIEPQSREVLQAALGKLLSGMQFLQEEASDLFQPNTLVVTALVEKAIIKTRNEMGEEAL